MPIISPYKIESLYKLKGDKELFMGVDPGRTGAVGVIDSNYNFIAVVDCPINKQTKMIDATEFARCLDPFRHQIIKCYLEKAQVMPHDAKTRAFGYGITYGTFKTILDLGGFFPIEVYPRTWKKFFHLSANKQLSLDLAKKMIHGAAVHLKRKKDHNRAEAILLSAYGLIHRRRK